MKQDTLQVKVKDCVKVLDIFSPFKKKIKKLLKKLFGTRQTALKVPSKVTLKWAPTLARNPNSKKQKVKKGKSYSH